MSFDLILSNEVSIVIKLNINGSQNSAAGVRCLATIEASVSVTLKIRKKILILESKEVKTIMIFKMLPRLEFSKGKGRKLSAKIVRMERIIP